MSRQTYLWARQAAAVFFPQRSCVCCGEFSLDGLCADCAAELADLRPCARCATFVRATETEHFRCQSCRGEELSFELARAAAVYGGHLREQLLSFKYHAATGLRRPLAALLLRAYRRYYDGLSFDAVVPVALHEQRLAERGYNQAQLLSHILSCELDIPHRPSWLRRVKATPSLAGSGDNAKQRRVVMRGAFAATPQVAGQRILLIDDIYTSGATGNAAALALKRKQAACVHVLTVAAGHDL